MNRRDFLVGAGALVAGTMATRGFGEDEEGQAASAGPISVDFGRETGRLPHFWENAMGSDRVKVGLRAEWREDLIRVRRDTGMQSVRCHGLFDDETGIAAAGAGNWNFLYVDKIYDFMLDHGVRPFVELSFMPEAFASSANRVFNYKGNVSPPRNWQDWHDMVLAYTDHCAKRYGKREVRGWKFEVWNEPNISFWAGTQEDYFELYRQSAAAVKKVDSSFQVGGPATAQLSWVPDLIRYCSAHHVPIDFVSTHVYSTDPQKHIFGQANLYPLDEVIPRGLALVNHQIESSPMPHLPLWITEWSSTNPAFIAYTIQQCIGLAETMSYWTFSNVFEEQGVPRGIFNNTFGLMGQRGIARPALHAFAFLHKLGEARVQTGEGPVLATKRADGSMAALVWNLIPLKGRTRSSAFNAARANEEKESEGAEKTFHLNFSGLAGRKTVQVSHVSPKIGSAIPAWEKMGSPRYPTRDQIAQLRAAAELTEPERRDLTAGEPTEFSITLPPNGVALLEFGR